jgi:hypothetical protein
VKNHEFTPKNHIFFQLRREARKMLGYFVWKITILCQKIIFFPILGGGARLVRPWIVSICRHFQQEWENLRHLPGWQIICIEFTKEQSKIKTCLRVSSDYVCR